MDIDSTLAEIQRLPVSDRLRLADAIYDGISEEHTEIVLSDAQKAELDRRLADLEANPDDVYSWEEVMAELRALP